MSSINRPILGEKMGLTLEKSGWNDTPVAIISVKLPARVL